MKTALTIGFFDGVHLGHQALLRRLRELPHATILTFSNHPQGLIRPPAPELLISYEERLKQLREYADQVLVVPFTAEFAQMRFDELLDHFDLSHIILGEGSVFGKDRGGTMEAVRLYGLERKIAVEYIPKVLFEGAPISSSRIRKALGEGNTILAEQLLGKRL
ncbi:MAG: FAD synthetase family protein [Verrucomicrobia bacterium]|nr:FAD synthetase family protein [Verrucomicrobiota bacterium]MBU6446069.1 FAD synthetase family protein [Verrucomicrobiota bacterium]MDE3048238.1 FAD synthetase family protein [Verrucomicrobiota bacterium]